MVKRGAEAESVAECPSRRSKRARSLPTEEELAKAPHGKPKETAVELKEKTVGEVARLRAELAASQDDNSALTKDVEELQAARWDAEVRLQAAVAKRSHLAC